MYLTYDHTRVAQKTPNQIVLDSGALQALVIFLKKPSVRFLGPYALYYTLENYERWLMQARSQPDTLSQLNIASLELGLSAIEHWYDSRSKDVNPRSEVIKNEALLDHLKTHHEWSVEFVGLVNNLFRVMKEVEPEVITPDLTTKIQTIQDLLGQGPIGKFLRSQQKKIASTFG